MPSVQTQLPGFGRSLNYVPTKKDPEYIGELFCNALSEQDIQKGRVALSLTTLREFTMLQLMNLITDKPDWHLKINDSKIAKKWKEEALMSGRDITPKMLDWCLAELRHLAKLVPKNSGDVPPLVVYNGDVVKSDTAVSVELHEALNSAVDKFEADIPERLRDWHPGSDDKVWDLVHPSLFPLVYGRTRVLENGETTTLKDCIARCGQGKIAPIRPDRERRESTAVTPAALRAKPFSSRFQWLPCEVDISNKSAKITSYINNLHPLADRSLYGLIEQLITVSIPLWELTLAPLRDPEFIRANRIEYTECTYDPDPENGPQTDGPQWVPDSDGEDSNYADEDDFNEKREQWYSEIREVVLPEPPTTFQPPNEPAKFNMRNSYKNLQVIVKLANIVLTPEKPEYTGGTWHVEGQLNEHIVATSLYYYSCSNITTSSLSFRQIFSDIELVDIGYDQDHHDWLPAVFGCEQDGPSVQEVGSVETREGRLLTFPNILQHRVGPFKLADSTRPGHRKIVALFLVDPNIKIISTAHVPCQRQDWWWELTQSTVRPSGDQDAANIGNIPRELQDHILQDVDFPISLQEASALRGQLMEERKVFVLEQGAEFESVTISLCEH